MVSGNGTVFLVSTDPVAPDELKALLENRGVEIRSFATIDELNEHAEPDAAACLVLDMRRPDIRASSPDDHVRAELVSMPVICVTGSSGLPLRATPPSESDAHGARSGLLGVVMQVLSAAGAALRARSTRSEIANRLLSLTPREHQVMERVVQGQSNKLIAHELGISSRTIEIHRAHVMAKTGAEGLSDLVRMAFAVGAVGAPERTDRIDQEI